MPSYIITQDTSTPITKTIFCNAFTDYMSNIHFGKIIESKHLYYNVRARDTIQGHTKAV